MNRCRVGYRNFCIEEKPDIVHLLSGYLISASVLEAAYALQIAVVVTLLDYWFVCPRITLLRSNGNICPDPVPPSRCAWCMLSRKRRFRVPDEKLRGIPGNAYTLLGKSRPVTRIMGMENEIQVIDDRREYLKQMLEQADAVISHSHFLNEKIRENGIFTDNVVYLPNGIDFDDGKAARPVKTQHPVRIGYIGQIAQHKGVHVLMDAFLAIHAAPEEAELHIYGDGSRWPEYTSFLQQKAKNHPAIFFKDSFAASQVGNVLDSLDVLVVPSIWFENRPTVILEAFSRRKPVIVSDLGGMAEMVQHDVDGLRFQAGDAYHLSVMLHRIVEDPALLGDLAAGIQPVKTIREEIDEIEQLYTKILKITPAVELTDESLIRSANPISLPLVPVPVGKWGKNPDLITCLKGLAYDSTVDLISFYDDENMEAGLSHLQKFIGEIQYDTIPSFSSEKY